jgi:ABC-type polysaccharide/polyol phosphate transport system ATPase subunit
MRARSLEPLELPQDVLLSVQGVSRGAPLPERDVPAWLKRVLPKSGLAHQLSTGRRDEDEDDPDDDIEEEFGEEPAALPEVSFDVRAGEGVGVAGRDKTATFALVRILTRALPPTSGRVVVRGRVASLIKQDLAKYGGEEHGRKAVFLVAHYLHWPRALLSARWDEILAFARLEELNGQPPRPYRNKTTMRLLFSAALHMDATVYVLDEKIPSDDEFGARCFDLLAERQREGAAVVQRAQMRVEDVARLCNEVLWFESNEVKFRGRPLEVAVAVEKAHREALHPLAAPILASLANSSEPAEITADGGTVEIELEVLRRHLDLGLWLEVADGRGHTQRLDAPERFTSEAAGLHRLRVAIPGGLLPDGVYVGRLVAEIAARGAEPMPPRELLAFELVSRGYEEAEGDAEDVMFELLPDWEDELPGKESEVEWDVGRASA